MSAFERAIQHVYEREGYYVNHKNDLGGETYVGIARNAHPTWSGWKIIDAWKAKNGTPPHKYKFSDSRLPQLIKDLYYQKFWLPYKLDKIQSENVALILFDAAMGQTGGFGWMVRRALANNGFSKYTVSDSPIMGMRFTDQIVTDINSINARAFYNSFRGVREWYFKYRASKPGQSVFLRGWLRRIAGNKWSDTIENSYNMAVEYVIREQYYMIGFLIAAIVVVVVIKANNKYKVFK